MSPFLSTNHQCVSRIRFTSGRNHTFSDCLCSTSQLLVFASQSKENYSKSHVPKIYIISLIKYKNIITYSMFSKWELAIYTHSRKVYVCFCCLSTCIKCHWWWLYDNELLHPIYVCLRNTRPHLRFWCALKYNSYVIFTNV